MKAAAAMASLGNDIALFARPGDEVAAPDTFEYYGVPEAFRIEYCGWPQLRGIGSLSYARRVARRCRTIGLPDLFYARHVPSLAAVRKFGRPMRLEVHAPPENLVQAYLIGRLLTAPNFQQLVVISDALRVEYTRLFPHLDDSRVIVAHDAADPPGKTMASARPSARSQIGYVGHLYPGKGMEIIAALGPLMPDADFHVIGGTKADLVHWRQRVAGVTNIIFHGHVAHGDLDEYMAMFDIALAPYQPKVSVSGSRGDVARWMSPLKLFEYMAHGKVIVASDLPVIREVLRSGQNAVLCDPQSPEKWREAIESLTRAPALAQELAAAARKQFYANHTWRERTRIAIGQGSAVHADVSAGIRLEDYRSA